MKINSNTITLFVVASLNLFYLQSLKKFDYLNRLRLDMKLFAVHRDVLDARSHNQFDLTEYMKKKYRRGKNYRLLMSAIRWYLSRRGTSVGSSPLFSNMRYINFFHFYHTISYYIGATGGNRLINLFRFDYRRGQHSYIRSATGEWTRMDRFGVRRFPQRAYLFKKIGPRVLSAFLVAGYDLRWKCEKNTYVPKRNRCDIESAISFLVRFSLLGQINKLKCLQYNVLTHLNRSPLVTKLDTLGYFKTDVILGGGLDFKCYVLSLVLTLLHSVVTMYQNLLNPLTTKAPKEAGYEPPVDRVATRGVFLQTFGLSGLRNERLPYNVIRFTPGYFTFWRCIRARYIGMNHLRFIRQARLTQYLCRFQHINNSLILKLSILSMWSVLTHTFFFLNVTEIRFAISCGLIFVNCRVCGGSNFQLQIGDYVQYKTTYLSYANVFAVLLTRYSIITTGSHLLKNFVWSDYIYNVRGSRYSNSIGEGNVKLFNHLHLPRLLTYYSKFFDVAFYIEINYILLAFVVIRLPRSANDFDHITARKSSVTSLRMLNWKYIT